MSRPRRTALLEFLHDEAAGGVALVVAAVAALVWANVAPVGYARVWTHHLDLGLDLDLRHWVNDGLMALFFFVVGLEIKRELVCGELRDRRAAALPVVAAVGGAAVPALVFVAITAGTPDVEGWAIPAATDIAFAVGVLALLGDRVVPGLKLLLLTIAIVDDVLAILVIALFYAEAVTAAWLLGGLVVLGLMALARRAGVASPLAYVPLALALWVCVHESGVHATIAGVALALMTPTGEVGGRAVLEELEHRLHPVSAFVVVPVFALANAGVDLGDGVLAEAAQSRLAWAIAAGLVLGKLVGIAGGSLLALRLRVGTLPDGVRPSDVWGVAALGGIGFTVSLFITQLAFDGEPGRVATAQVAILSASVVAAALGAAVVMLTARR